MMLAPQCFALLTYYLSHSAYDGVKRHVRRLREPMETLKGILGTRSIEFDVGLLIEVPPRYDTIGSPDPACLCIQSTRRQKKVRLRESGCLILAQGRGSLIFDLLVVCVAVADGRDVVAFKVQSVCGPAPLGGPAMRRSRSRFTYHTTSHSRKLPRGLFCD
jgi:hypothetical protein